LWSSHAQHAGAYIETRARSPVGETGIVGRREERRHRVLDDASANYTAAADVEEVPCIAPIPPASVGTASRVPRRRSPDRVSPHYWRVGLIHARAACLAGGVSSRPIRVVRGVHAGRSDCRLQLLGRHLALGYRRTVDRLRFGLDRLRAPAPAVMLGTDSVRAARTMPSL
jgi:hypothetical protein